MTTELYGIYLAAFPFLDSNQTKLRPVIVVSQPYGPFNIVTVIPISSKNNVVAPVDVAIIHWQKAGLVKPSVARVHRLTSFLQEDLVSQLGELNSRDIQELKRALGILLEI